MKTKVVIINLFLGLFLTVCLSAQNNRITTKESIGWYNVLGTIKLSGKFGLHTEYQWRRDDIITLWQQSVLRAGINYQVNPRVLTRVGYGWIETYPYGEITINSLGRQFTEHRLFEMLQLSHKEGIFDLTHRFMLEQRFVGKYTSADVKKEDQFPLTNRIRYMLRAQVPLKKTEGSEKMTYLAAYDEVLIGFGKNVNANVFDQNRIGVIIGHKFNKTFRIEGGYLNQIVEFGRQLNGKNIYQHNNGIIVNTYINLDLSHKA